MRNRFTSVYLITQISIDTFQKYTTGYNNGRLSIINDKEIPDFSLNFAFF